ncbi:Chemotaxis phosphatase CheX-like domain-containing protein [Gammaproteobacteria bacterium]
MISGQAQNSFDQILKKSLTSVIAGSSGHFCEIVSLSGVGEIGEGEFAIFTISSSVFRLLALFHLNTDVSAKNFIATSASLDADLSDEAYRDVFLEFSNMCCGVVNRELLKYFPYIGMSTPYVLLNKCIPFLSEIAPGYIRHFRITIDHSVVLHVTFCICDYGDIHFDFKADPPETVVETSELELF